MSETQTVTPAMIQEMLNSACVDLCRMQAANVLGGNEMLKLKVSQIRSLIKALDVPGARNKSESELLLSNMLQNAGANNSEIKI